MTGCDHTEPRREKSIGSLEAVRKKINISLCERVIILSVVRRTAMTLAADVCWGRSVGWGG